MKIETFKDEEIESGQRQVGAQEEGSAEVNTEWEALSSDEKLRRVFESNTKLKRFSFYSAAFSLVVALAFAGFASYQGVVMETKLSEQKNEVLSQVESELSVIRPVKQPPRPEYADLEIPAGVPVLGDPEAPVTIVEFADFQCPFCGFFFTEVQQKLLEEYVDTGKAKFIYLDFAFLGQESVEAANAAKCAADQGKYWEYHDKLFQSQDGENQGAFERDKLLQYGRALGLNMSDFTSCVEEGTHVQEVSEQTKLGQSIGVTGTPTTIINRKIIVGAQGYEVFASEIDKILGE